MKSIRLARERCGLTQKALAETMGVSQSTVALWESDLGNPKSTTLLALADLLECSVDTLLGREPYRELTAHEAAS